MNNEPRLDEEEREQAHRLEGVPTSVIFEAIRREGRRELSRTARALWWSGVAAGLAISTSVLAKGFLVAVLPEAEWTPAVSNLGYTVGFLIVILGRLQLFTENTITPILTLFLSPTRECLARTARLWAIVFVANMLGCLAAAVVLVTSNLVPAAQFEGILAVSRHYADATAMQHLTWGIPAGFLMASLVWVLPRLEGTGEVLMIIILTYMIGLGGLSHVVAGATELFILTLRGELGVAQALLGGVLPAFVGNVIGGTGIFAALAYAQVRDEM